jgi:hypothetical protein
VLGRADAFEGVLLVEPDKLPAEVRGDDQRDEVERQVRDLPREPL